MTAVPKDERYRFDGFDLSLQKRELTGTDGRAVELATAEFNLLELFVKRPSRVMTRDNIVDPSKATSGRRWTARSTHWLAGCARRSRPAPITRN